MSAPPTGGRPVAVIGLGKIGLGVAALLSGAGYALRGYDPFPEASEAFQEFGTPAATAAEAAEGADCVLLAVFDDEQLIAALSGEDGVLATPTRVAVVLSTVTVDTIAAANELATAHGASLLDCGVSGGRKIRSGERMAVSVGGDEEAFASVRDVLETFGDPVVYMGGSGAGMIGKIARNMIHFCSVLADWEGLSLAQGAGLDADAFRAFVSAADANSGGTMGYGDAGDISRDARLASYATKDLDAALHLARSIDLDLPGAVAAARAWGGIPIAMPRAS